MTLDGSALEQFLAATQWTPEQWTEFVADIYAPGGSPAFYRFVCRGCRGSKFGWDRQ